MQGQGKKGHVVDFVKFQLMRESSSTEKMVKAVIKCLPTGKKRELRVDLDTPSFKKWERLRRVTQY